MTNLTRFLTLLQCTLITLFTTSAKAECRPQSPIFPRPRSLTKSPFFRSSAANLTAILDSAYANKINAGFNTNNVSISIGLVSFDQTSPSIPAWEYHHRASGNVNGTKKVDRDSLYMIGSVSKILTDVIFIKSGVPGGDPVTKYVPELRDEKSRINWGAVTLEMLAGQLSGIPPNYGFSEYYYLHPYFEYLGFPPINDSEYSTCGVTSLNDACTKDVFLKGLLTLHPVSSPNTRPVYSNIAFTLLMYAVQGFYSSQGGKSSLNATTYTSLLEEFVTHPLGMANTFPSGTSTHPDVLEKGVIPPVGNNFNGTYGLDSLPGGGLISSVADLSSLVYSILTRSIFGNDTLSQARVREWLLPRSFLGSTNTFLGMPWEIYRPSYGVLFPGRPESGEHTVTIVAKDGTAYGYRARIAVVDEYGVGVVVLVAGDTGIDALEIVYGAVMSVLLPGIDEAARREVEGEGGYVGRFAETKEGVGVEARMEVVGDGSSLTVSELRRNGTDMLKGIEDIWAVSLGAILPSLKNNGTWRLYPSEVMVEGEEVIGGRKVGVVREDWRLWWDIEVLPQTGLPGREFVTGDCSSWSVADWVYYGGEAVDRVVFVKDKKTGDVLGVDFPFLRTGVVGKVGLL